MMSTAIQHSESQNPDRRILAAIVFSFVGSPEAKADLKILAANDPNAEENSERTDLGPISTDSILSRSDDGAGQMGNRPSIEGLSFSIRRGGT